MLDVALGERTDGTWSAFEVGVVVARQNGKGAILEARELAGLFLFGEQLILHSAHEFKTAQEAFRRVLALVEANDWMRAEVARVRTSHGEEGIELTSGARLRFVARSTGSGRGFSGDCVILDEAYNLDGSAMAALLPTLSARKNPQLWYTSSAGMATSSQLHRVRRRAISGEQVERLAWMEWHAGDDPDPDDPQAWALANPALGTRITEEFVRSERAAMPEAEFRRERLGVWDDEPATTAAAVIPMTAWLACVVDDATPVVPEVFAVDVTPDRLTAAVAFAARVGDRVHVGVADHRPGQGTEWVRVLVADAAQRGVPVVTDDPTLAAELGESLRRTSTRELVEACGSLFDAVQSRRLRVRRQRSLEDAVAAGRSRPLSHGWAWDRRGVDVSPLVAATLAFHAAANQVQPAEVEAFAIVL